jgi:DNA-binding transcriptional ArsR family regulator
VIFYILNRTNEGQDVDIMYQSVPTEYYFSPIEDKITDWQEGDPGVVVVNVEHGTYGTNDRAGFVAYVTAPLDLTGTQIFPTVELQKIPTPTLDSNGTGFINITWSALPDPSGLIAGYTVYRSTTNDSDGSWSLVGGTVDAPLTDLWYMDTAVTSGVDYYYSLKVCFTGYQNDDPGQVDNYQDLYFGEGSVTMSSSPGSPTVDYIEIVDMPSTGLIQILDMTVGVGTTITGYAAAFNSSTGYIGDVSVEWSVINMGWAQASTVPSSGTSSDFYSGPMGGTAIWTAAYYNGTWFNDTVVFTINPPSADYIEIVDTPGGTPIPDKTVGVGYTIIGTAAAFNNTVGYFTNISVSWTVNNTGGATAETEPSNGTSSTFNSSSQGGSAQWIADDGHGHSDTVTFTILPPDLDYIRIVDTPNSSESVIIDQAVVTGTTIWGYAAGFNNTIGYFGDVSVNWDVIITGGATASTSPSNGTGSQFDAGSTGGQATWTASDGAGHSYSIDFTINDMGIDWIQIEDAPGGGGNEILDQIVDLGFTIDGYATAYNFTIGYIGSISVSWTVNNVGSNASTTPSFGISSEFNSGYAEGTASWTADGGGPTDTVVFTILSPTFDYINITDAPDGTPLTNVILPIGGQVTAYASGYNNTNGFIGLVEVNWTGGGGIWDPGTGTSSTYTAGNTTGVYPQTAENVTMGVSDTFDVEIVTTPPSYILLTDAPDSTELWNIILAPGEQVTAYASGYNNISAYIGLIDVNWSQSPSLGSFDNLTGTSTTFTTGASPGQTTITGENDTQGVIDTFEVTISPPPVDYIFLTDFPNGSALTTVILNVGEQVTAYASGYNVTSGYVGLVNVNWSQAPTLGSFDNLSGTSTIFTAGLVGGSTTITGQNLALGVSDIFNININPPTVDYVLLTDSANGLELTTVILSTGEQVTAYASSYNTTSGFLGVLDVNWSQVPTMGSFDNLSGVSTTFTTGGIGGLTTITGENLTLGVSDTFEINVNNATVDYIQIRNAPSEGGPVITNLILSVGQSHTLWAAAYNYSSGYLGDFMSTTWIETSGGSIITVTSPGASTSVQAQMIGGFSTITANYSGVVNSTSVTVSPPAIDFIVITDNPNGTGLITVTLPVGGQTTAYASGYNDTSGYVGLVEVDWTQNPSLGSFDNDTGTSTIFTAGLEGGLTTITVANISLGVSDTFEIDIMSPTVDYMLLTDTPNGTALVIVTLNVGESVTAYSSGYNTTGVYTGLINVNWSESSGLGTFNNDTGTSSIFTAGLVGGSTTVKGENVIMGMNNTFDVNINPPTMDFILIRTQPGGGGINLCDPANYQSYPVGTQDTYYGAMYNHTAGYFDDIPENSTWGSSDPSIVTVSSPGSSSDLTCDSNNWGGPVTITLTALGKVNTSEITVLEPTVDYIQIRDEPGSLGNIVTSRTYIVSQVDVFYAAGYNDTAGYLGEVEAVWWSNDTAVGQVTSPGLWTNFSAQEVDHDGLCHITAEFNGVTDSTGALTVLAPRIDFITIVDIPNVGGNWVASGTYDEGDEDVFWAAGFNLTTDYVKDVDATWESNNTIVGKVTPGPGTYTEFTAGWKGGYCMVTATYGDSINQTGPLFIININQLPTAKADHYNGTGFEGGNYSFSIDITLRVTGRKENIITMELEEDGHIVEEVVVTRHSNQPDIGVISYEMDVNYVYEAVLRYNGNNGGSNPIIVTFEFLGNTYSVHLLFNSQHGEEQTARIKFNDVLQLVGTVFFDAYRSTDFEGYLMDYAWEFGDGNTADGETLAHTYEENGDYTVALTVTDDEGGTNTETITVIMENIDNNNQVNAILGSNASQGYLNGSGQYVVILQCPADLVIEDIYGRKVGLLEGSSVNTLEESFAAKSYNDIEVYFIPKDEMYIFKVRGTGIGYYDLSIMGMDNNILKSIRFFNVTCTDITIDTYIIDFTESRITIVTNEENKIYSLEFMLSSDGYDEHFILFDMKLNKDVKHIYTIKDWGELNSGKPVTLSIDEDGNGKVDKDIDLKSGLNGDDVDVLFLETPVSAPGFPFLMFIIAGVFCAIGVGTLLTEVGKWGLLILFLPLYTRLKKEELLDQPTRYKIFGYIIGNPGAYFGLIKQDLELGSGQLVYHLKQLKDAKMIYSREDGVKKRFYPSHIPKPKSGPHHISDIQDKILGIISNNSGIGQKKIASNIGISRQVAGYHLTIMEQKGIINKKNAGRENRYYPSGKMNI